MIRLDTTTPVFEPEFRALLDQSRETTESVDQAVSAIIADVRTQGDIALLRYTERFDRLALNAERLRITDDEIEQAISSIEPELTVAMQRIEAVLAA